MTNEDQRKKKGAILSKNRRKMGKRRKKTAPEKKKVIDKSLFQANPFSLKACSKGVRKKNLMDLGVDFFVYNVRRSLCWRRLAGRENREKTRRNRYKPSRRKKRN